VGDERITPPAADELASCFAAHAGEMFGYACALARGDTELAGDLVQAAFQAAARAWPVLRDLAEEQQRGWLRRTVANMVVSGMHREAAFRDRLARIEMRNRRPGAGASGPAVSPVTLEHGWQLIGELPEQQHVIALMHWQLDMKETEIAEVLGLTIKTVSSTLHRVEARLITLLDPGQRPGPGEQEGEPS
jgi:RNA polymerase sigma factor (sigma-70 family)